MSDIQIVIPSRYQSTRLPGKPLVKIAGVEMIRRVVNIAVSVCRSQKSCECVVATDDQRIVNFCEEHELPVVMTPVACKSGTERCWAAVSGMDVKPKLVVNLQGDNPLCPPHVLGALIDTWRAFPEADVFTPCVHLGWDEYDRLVESKKTTPFSGTTILVDRFDNALAFSKKTIPAIRNVEKAKASLEKSPVRRHIGLYAYTYRTLERYAELGPSSYEPNYIEGLEQMRFLENGMKIKVVPVDYRGRRTTSGVDCLEDVVRVEQILAEFGELEL